MAIKTAAQVYPNAVTPPGETARFMRESPYAIRPSDRTRSTPRGSNPTTLTGTFGVVHPDVSTPGSTGIGAPGKGGALRGSVNQGEGVPAPPDSGSQSGPGILENWFKQRAEGTDPAYEYSLDRGMDEIDNRMAAGGSYNSGARGLQLSDFATNMGARRMGQLDALATGASGEHLGRTEQMFRQGLGLAGGQSGLASAYDLGAAGNIDAANRALTQMFLNKAGVDAAGNQGAINTGLNIWSIGAGGNRNKAPGQ